MAFVLANRMQNVMGSIVNEDQTAYIKGRYMGCNIRQMSDIIDFYDMHEKSGLLLMLDFKKAFDSLEWNFLLKTLVFFNFGPSFIRWIKTIYKLPEACVKNNGYISDNFTIHRGIRQGCPVSALIFILCVEVLGLKVRQHPKLLGFDLGNKDKPVKVIQYADDGVLFLNNKDELCNALNLLDKFGKVAGTVLNNSKCEGLWLGKDKQQQNGCKIFGLKWPNQIKCLGIYMGHNKELNNIRNWVEKINDVESLLMRWKKRDLTLFGKVLIIKSFAISKLILAASLLPIPENCVKEINKILFNFLWGSKDKVKRIKVIKKVKDGGLGMIDVQSLFDSLKSGWVKRIMCANPNKSGWAQLPRYFLQKFFECDFKLNMNFDESIIFNELKKTHPFYKEVLLCYNKVYVTTEEEFKNDIYNQPLWGNKFINVKVRTKNKVLFLQNWIRSGINYVNDLRFVDGCLDENFLFQKVTAKNNILIEIMMMKNVLLPYKTLLLDIGNVNKKTYTIPYENTKEMYNRLTDVKVESVINMSNYLQPYCNSESIEEKCVFQSKLINQNENKLKEFNYKLINGILPCNVNLMRWRKLNTGKCDVCDESQTIEHLLFDCKYVKGHWKYVEQALNVRLSFCNIICGIQTDSISNNTITLAAFLIYKEWLIASFNKKCRIPLVTSTLFKAELQNRYKIYRHCNMNSFADMVEKLLNLL